MVWDLAPAQQASMRADWALIDQKWHRDVVLRFDSLTSLVAVSPNSALRPSSVCRTQWIGPAQSCLRLVREDFLNAEGLMTRQSVKLRFTQLLNDGCASVGVAVSLLRSVQDPACAVKEASLLAQGAQSLKLSFSYFGLLDWTALPPSEGPSRDKRSRPSQAPETFEAQLSCFESLVASLDAWRTALALGWALWVRLDPNDAQVRSMLTAVRVRLAHLPMVIELAGDARTSVSGALFELVHAGLLDAQVSLYAPRHKLSVREAELLAGRGVSWTLLPSMDEAFLLEQIAVAETAGLALLFERTRHPMFDVSLKEADARESNAAVPPGVTPLFAAQLSRLQDAYNSQGLPKTFFREGEVATAIALEMPVHPAGDPELERQARCLAKVVRVMLGGRTLRPRVA